jgi:UDP-glucose 4-epimerase
VSDALSSTGTAGRRPMALVTGATGVVGPSLIALLLERGYAVRALVRSTPPAGVLPAAVATIHGAINDLPTLRVAVAGCDAVFHLAAKLHITDPGSETRPEYEQVNVEGTRALARAAREAGVGRLIAFSTINVYGPTPAGAIWDETSPLRPDSWYAETKAQAEDAARAELSTVVLRLAAVYGPRMKGNYPRLLRTIARGRFIPIGDGRNRRTLVHVRDVCAAALAAAEHPAAINQTYNVTDGQIHTLREIIDVLCLVSGKRPPPLHLPIGPVRLAAGVLERGFRALGRTAPIGRSTIDKLVEDIAVSGTRIGGELGVRPEVDLLTGWRETARAVGG